MRLLLYEIMSLEVIGIFIWSPAKIYINFFRKTNYSKYEARMSAVSLAVVRRVLQNVWGINAETH